MYVCFNACVDSSSFGCSASILLLAWELELQAKSLLSCSLDLWWYFDPSNSSIMCNRTQACPVIFPHPPCHSDHPRWGNVLLIHRDLAQRNTSKKGVPSELVQRGIIWWTWSWDIEVWVHRIHYGRGVVRPTHRERGKLRKNWMSMSLSESLEPAIKIYRLCFWTSGCFPTIPFCLSPVSFTLIHSSLSWLLLLYSTLHYLKRNHMLASLLKISGWSLRFQVT